MADLLTRYAPAGDVPAEPVTAPTVSVSSLLEREGRTPGRASAPVRGGDDRYDPAYDLDPEYAPAADGEPPAEGPRTTLLVRRGAIVAGTLLAAGSVFGAAVVTDATISQSGSDQALGAYPGQGRLDQPSVPAEAVPTVVDPTAQTGSLDPGVGAPTSWMPLAFPGAEAPAAAPADEPRASRAPAGGGTPAAPTGGSGSSGTDERSAGGSSGSGSTGTDTSTDDHDGSDDSPPPGGGGGGDDAPSDSGGSGLVGGVVGGLGSAVGALGAGLLG